MPEQGHPINYSKNSIEFLMKIREMGKEIKRKRQSKEINFEHHFTENIIAVMS